MRHAVDGRTKRASERRESRRAEILEAALEEFGRKGFHQTSVSDIIEAAGVARGTFYTYFESKSAIFLELLDQLLVRLRDAIIGVDRSEGAPAMQVQLEETVRRLLATFADNRLLSTIIIREAVGLDDEVDRRLRGFYRRIREYIRLSLVEGQRLGVVRRLDTEVAASCILGSFKQFMEQFATADGEDALDVDRTALAVLDFNLRGLQPS
ncbi:MAG: TetR/AcrR family transcriptional regulator [Myxococcales bacterium]|nr:TetR/AcrR family transcriptional regulator [Myxococcales bacterium]